jgi:hypothetical protein
MSEAERAVRAALDAAGLDVGADELEQLVAYHPVYRAIIARLDAIPGVAETFPDLILDLRAE